MYRKITALMEKDHVPSLPGRSIPAATEKPLKFPSSLSLSPSPISCHAPPCPSSSPLLIRSCLACAVVHAESPAKATDLLGGKDLAGWQYVATPATDLKAVCTLKADGVIAVSGAPIGYLATTGQL